MKFKYIGADNTFSPELIVTGVKKKGEYFKSGETFDVPDKFTSIIDGLKISGLFEEVPNKKEKK